MGNSPLGHPGILNVAGITPSESTVGGQIFLGNDGLTTTEWSGHFGQNWTPALREEFQNFMQQNGVNIVHHNW
jgi:hypothetical protein